MSKESNVYPLLPGRRIRLEKVGEIYEDGNWREIHRHQFSRIQLYDFYMDSAKQRRRRRASQPSPASPAPSPPPAPRLRRHVEPRRAPEGRGEEESCPTQSAPLQRRRKTKLTHCSTNRTQGAFAASVTGRVPLQRRRKTNAIFYSAHAGPRCRLFHRESPPATSALIPRIEPML